MNPNLFASLPSDVLEAVVGYYKGLRSIGLSHHYAQFLASRHLSKIALT